MSSATPASGQEIIAYIKTLPPEDIDIMKVYFLKDIDFIEKLSPDGLDTIHKHLDKLGLVEKAPTQTDDDRIQTWAEYGLSVSVPEGRAWFCQAMMLAKHDEIPYCVNEHDRLFLDRDDRMILHSIRHREMVIACYHEKIKAVYEYCVSLGRGPVWVLMGGRCSGAGVFRV